MAKKKKQTPPARPGKKAASPRAHGDPATPEVAEPQSTSPAPFPIAGLCASAGGLEAYKRFFSTMPTDSGIAFVLLPHLDPTHESLMVELVSRQTSMPVVEATEGVPVKPNQVFIIPPNKFMTIAQGVLRLTEPVDRWATSFDVFLRSLADDQHERAICIILSGTGSHGVNGLKAIKMNDGMVMVQDPATAEYDRMPHSAAATGLADYVLPPERMAEALIRYARYFQIDGPSEQGDGGSEQSDGLERVLALIRSRTRRDFRCYRKKMLLRRISRRMGLQQIPKLPDYLRFLQQNPDEVKQLSRDLLIGVTSFFRDPEAFQALRKDVLTPLIESKPADAPIRVWVPGAATGEEAYSICMLLLEQVEAAKKSCLVQVFASDVDDVSLEVGRQGIYPDSIAADVGLQRLAQFFTKGENNTYRVSKQLREPVVFAAQDVTMDAPFSKLDVISCRNLLIYLEPEIQKKILALLHFALNDGGYLFLGPSETIGRQTDLFEMVNKKWRIFRRLGPSRPELVDFPLVTPRYRVALGPAKPLLPIAVRPVDLGELTRQQLLETYAPATVLIDRNNEICYFFGPTPRYLEQPSGAPTLDLLALVRVELRPKLRLALSRARREEQPATERGVRVPRNDGHVLVSITARPVRGLRAPPGLLLVVFEDEPAAPPPPKPGQEADAGVRQLQSELKGTRDDLQSAIEQLEGSNQELKAANEEVMSMNEELQSANEELESSKEELQSLNEEQETSKEELQSLNEELVTVNSQLQEKVQELEAVNNNMTNLLNCTDIATVFLDAHYRVKLFTPAATGLFNLIPTDVGRPLDDIVPKVADPELKADAERVLRNLAPREQEVAGERGQQYLRRITPYQTGDRRIEGIVITFLDVTKFKRAEQATRDSEERFRIVFESAPNALITVNNQSVIVMANTQTERLFGYHRDELIGQPFDLLIPERIRGEHPELREDFFRNPRTSPLGKGADLFGRRKDGSEFAMEIGLSPARIKDEVAVLAAVVDITQRKQTEQQLREMTATLERRVEERTQALRKSENEILQVAAKEQQRIGQDLHDSVGQEVTGLSLMCDNLAGQLSNLADKQQVDKISGRLREVLRQIRELSRGLMPVDGSPEGLMLALTDLAERVTDQSKVACTFRCEPPVFIENAQTSGHLFRIAQEAVANALQHGKAHRIGITLAYQEGGWVALSIEDNGAGIPNEPRAPAGNGLRIMRHRASLLNGAVSIGPVEPHGTRVVSTFKMENDHEKESAAD